MPLASIDAGSGHLGRPARTCTRAALGALAGALLWLSGPALADDAPADCGRQAVRRVQDRYDGIQDLSARFEQSTRSVSLAGSPLAGDETSTGRVVLAKPGRMRWEYAEPEPSLVVSDGKLLWLYDPTAREVQRMVVDGGFLSGAALQFLLGGGRIEDEFRVEVAACEDEHVALRLLPRQEASYERLGLTVEAETGNIVETTIVDLLGNETRIRFSELRVDQHPAADRFRFEVPDGVEVIDLVPPS